MAPTNTCRPAIDAKLIAQTASRIDKIGSNLDQIIRQLNAGCPGDRVEGALDDALRELREVLDSPPLLMQKLALEPYQKIKDK